MSRDFDEFLSRLEEDEERARAARGVTPQKCPQCGRLVDSASSFDEPEAVPRPGDVTVCLYCSVTMEFTKEGPFNILTQEDIDGLPKHIRKELDGIKMRVRLIRALKGYGWLGRE